MDQVTVKGDSATLSSTRKMCNPPNTLKTLDNPSAKEKRVWNSYEDLILIELWSKYRDDVTSASKGDRTVYKQFEDEMNGMSITVNSIEIEDRMQYMWTRYLYERNTQIRTGDKSVWRLYPLLEYVFEAPKINEENKWQNEDEQDEEKVLGELFNEIELSSQQPGYDFQKTSSSYKDVEFRPLFLEISMEKLLQIQKDNQRLSEEVNKEMEELRIEREKLKQFEMLRNYIYTTEKCLLKSIVRYVNTKRTKRQ